MSIAKDKRIKKLGKTRIWPSLLGLFLLIIIFTVIAISTLIFHCADIAHRKLLQCNSESVKISELYKEYDKSEAEGINDTVSAYLNLSTDVAAVSVTDNYGNKLWSSNNFYPANDNVVDFEYQYGDTAHNINMLSS